MHWSIRTLAAGSFALAPVAALAELPEPVRAMIEAAIETGNAELVASVANLARQTNPTETAGIDAILAGFNAEQRKLAEAKARADEQAIRTAGIFENWSGKGELGGFRSTGNSNDTGVTGALALTRNGIDWRHKLRGRADYRRSDGETTREQFLVAYEPNYKLNERLFAYGLAQYERDRFQGFSGRYSASGGLGYDIITGDSINLTVQGGPAWRRTEFIGTPAENNIAALAALEFDWNIAENLKLIESASAYLQSGNSSFNSTTGLQASIANDLSLRLSYTMEHDTDPGAGSVKTDTLSRVTLIYDF
jgi:putative salt-induced outer membrane protein